MRATPDFKLIVTVTSARKDVGTLDEQEVTLAELEQACTQHDVGEKDGEALIPAEFGACADPCRNVTKGSGWDCGGASIHRLSANVIAMTALGVDIDDISQESVQQIDAALEARGLYYIAWSTHSHAPPERCRLRLLFPFAEPLRLTNPRQWSAVAWAALVKHLGLPLGTDFSCRNPDRIYYLPRVATAESPRFAGVQQGELLDWRDVPGLTEALAAANAVHSVPVAPAPEEDATRPVDLEVVRGLLGRIEGDELVRALLKGEALTPPPDRREAGGMPRREAWRRITVHLANVVEGWESTEALLELLRPSWRAEVQDSPQDHTAWEKITELFAGARASAPSYKAEKAARRAALNALITASIRRRHEQHLEAVAQAPAAAAQTPTASTPRVHKEYPLTDMGNAERFIDQHAHVLRYVADLGHWVRWDGKRWEQTDDKVAQGLARHTAREMLREVYESPEERRPFIRKWQHASEARRALESMAALAKTFEQIRIKAGQLDADPMLLNVQNGTIDLRTGALRAHVQSDQITKISPVAFDSAAACPTWDRFLERILPSEALRAHLKRCIGYSLTGHVSEQVLFFAHGHGSNGKSTFLTTLQHVLGEYARQGSPDLLLASHNDPHPTSKAALKGARFVVCSEVEQGRTFAETTVKELTGGDVISARFMRENFFDFNPTHKIFLAANHKPKVRGTDHAIWRRIRLIPFYATITEAEKDPALKDKLKAEASGILAWAVRGCLEWQRDGLGTSPEVLEATQGYREDQDLIAQFITDVLEAVPTGFVSSAELYRSYEKWCIDAGEKAWSGRALSNALIERGYVARKLQQVRGFGGLKVRQQSRASQVALAGSATQPEANA